MKKLRFDIKNITEILDIVHDKPVDLGTLKFESNILRIDLKREDLKSQDTKVKRKFLFKIVEYPIILSRMTFYDVKSYEIINDQEIRTYSLNDFSTNDNELVLNFCEATKLKILFESKINMEFTDLEILNEYGRF